MNQKTKKPDSVRRVMLIILAIASVLLCMLLVSRLPDRDPEVQQNGESTPVTQTTEETEPQQTPPGQTETQSSDPLDSETPEVIVLENGIQVDGVGSYTGIYMEDGSDELVSGVMYLTITNSGENDIEYAELIVQQDGTEYFFTVSTLPVGMSVVLLEKNRADYPGAGDYSVHTQHIALYKDVLELHEDQLQFQILDGAINVINQSGEDISEDIVIYYKNDTNGTLYGGITYRIRLEGGLDDGEVRQIMANHFSDNGSRIMFVTIG